MVETDLITVVQSIRKTSNTVIAAGDVVRPAVGVQDNISIWVCLVGTIRVVEAERIEVSSLRV